MTTAERRANEKARRRQEILEAARQEFFQRGFRTPTVDDVAARANVSKGTIYLYFESKEEILAHLLLEGLGLLVAEMDNACSTQPAQAEQALRTLANSYLQFNNSHSHYFRLIMAFDRGRFQESITSELHDQVMHLSLQGLSLLAHVIEAGAQTGEFRVQAPWQAAGIVWAALNGVLVLMAHPLRQRLLETDLDTMFEATLNLVIQGLKDGDPESFRSL